MSVFARLSVRLSSVSPSPSFGEFELTTVQPTTVPTALTPRKTCFNGIQSMMTGTDTSGVWMIRQFDIKQSSCRS